MSDCTPNNGSQILASIGATCDGKNLEQILYKDIPEVITNIISEGGDNLITEVTLNNIIAE